MAETERLSNYYELLTRFRSTVDGLLSSGRSDIWSTYGGLRRAREIVCAILFDEMRDEMDGKMLDYLVEMNNKKTSNNEKEMKLDYQEPLTVEQFIEECLLSYCTSYVIGKAFFDADQGLLNKIYKENAFLRKRPCVNLLVMCFNALEQNSLEILSCINKQLVSKQSFMEYFKEETKCAEVTMERESSSMNVYSTSSGSEQNLSIDSTDFDSLNKINSQLREKQVKTDNNESRTAMHAKRRSLHQDVLMTSALAAVMETNEDGLIWFDEADKNSLINEPIDAARHRMARMREISRSESSLFNEHGQIETEKAHSDDNGKTEPIISKQKDYLQIDNANTQEEDAAYTFKPLRRSSNVISTSSFKKGHSRSKSDQIGLPKAAAPEDLEDDANEEKLSTSAPVSQLEEPRPQDYYYQPEDGYMFPKPYKGQSLISYLNSRSYDTGAELDKENAHFSICEALITAIEQMKCSKFFDSDDDDDSDEEIKLLKRKINERKFRKRLMKMDLQQQQAFSDKSTSTSQSTSSFFSGSTFSSSFSSSSTDRTTPHDSTSQKTLSRSWENVSLSPHQNKIVKITVEENTTAAAENSIAEEVIEPDDYSAEFVAKSLLKKFDNRKLPAASELKWMVTEEQVPQTLLPLPNAWPVSPDDALYYNNRIQVNEDDGSHSCNSMPARLRGNFEWAPPRPQIIFTNHPYVKRKVLLQRQHYRCAGCGLKVSQSLSKRFRYCEYLGKYFCSSCHQNQLSVLPSKIINKWDFKQYPISDFAYEFLKKIRHEPLFNISAIDGSIYKRIKPTEVTRELRLKLHYANGFLKTCRLGQSIYSQLEKLPSHIMDDIHLYTIEDFIQVKNGELQSVLKSCINSSLRHINSCQLCKVKGFVCEYCRDGEDILYPFELNKVSTCPLCMTCYHKECFVPEKCPKCERIRARQRLLDSKSSETERS